MCMTHNGGAGPMAGPSMRDSYSSTSTGHIESTNSRSSYAGKDEEYNYR